MHLYSIPVADVLLGLLAFVQGVATLAIDLTRTHATHPDWPGHARFHVVWQVTNIALLTVLTEWLLWSPALPESLRFHLALAMTVIPMLGFLGALLFRGAYGGTLRDRGGVPPLVVGRGGTRREVDLNSVAVYVGLLTSAVLLAMHHGIK